MSTRGRHARRSSISFYRDALLLFGGIVIVGALVFGGLSLWASRAGGDDLNAAPDPSATVPPATETTTTTTTSPPTTTEATAPFTTSTDTVPATPETTLREARPPSEVRAIVLNSIGVTGLAGSVSQELADLGYQMAQADNDSPELSDTMIFHADGYSIEALELREALGTGTVADDADLTSEWDVDIVVVLGRSFQE